MAAEKQLQTPAHLQTAEVVLFILKILTRTIKYQKLLKKRNVTFQLPPFCLLFIICSVLLEVFTTSNHYSQFTSMHGPAADCSQCVKCQTVQFSWIGVGSMSQLLLADSQCWNFIIMTYDLKCWFIESCIPCSHQLSAARVNAECSGVRSRNQSWPTSRCLEA